MRTNSTAFLSPTAGNGEGQSSRTQPNDSASLSPKVDCHAAAEATTVHVFRLRRHLTVLSAAGSRFSPLNGGQKAADRWNAGRQWPNMRLEGRGENTKLGRNQDSGRIVMAMRRLRSFFFSLLKF